MIKWFEKHNEVSFIITIIIAISIFYISSLQFPEGPPGPKIPFKSYFYHFSIFFLFAFFLLISIAGVKNHNKKLIFLGVIISLLYGVLDELHQLFVPGRNFSMLDILTDSVGVLSISVLYVLRIRRNKKRGK